MFMCRQIEFYTLFMKYEIISMKCIYMYIYIYIYILINNNKYKQNIFIKIAVQQGKRHKGLELLT